MVRARCHWQHTMMGENDKLFGLHTYHDLLADYFMDLGIPQAAVNHEAVEAFITLSEGVRPEFFMCVYAGLCVHVRVRVCGCVRVCVFEL